MMQILAIFSKNLKIIFRNWISFLLLILGPFLLIVILGLVFSSSSLQGISIGIIADDSVATAFSVDVSEKFDVKRYDTLDACVLDVKLAKTTICTAFSDDFSYDFVNNSEKKSTGKVVLRYDNSQLVLASTIVRYLVSKFGLASEQITLEATKQLLLNLGDIVAFLKSSHTSIQTYAITLAKIESQMVQFDSNLNATIANYSVAFASLQQAKIQLESADTNGSDAQFEIQQSFDEFFVMIRDSQTQLTQAKSEVETQKKALNESQEAYEQNYAVLREIIEKSEGVINNNTKSELLEQIDVAQELLNGKPLDDVLTELETFEARLEQAENELALANANADSLLAAQADQTQFMKESIIQAEELYMFLHTAKNQTSQSVKQFSQASKLIADLNQSLSKNIAEFEQLTGQKVDSFVAPINVDQKPLITDVDMIYLLFPLILPMIILFISLLFANVILLEEIYSSAQIRSFILPLHDAVLLLGFLLTNAALLCLQIGVLLFFAEYQLHIPLLDYWPYIAVVSLLLILIFSLTGMIIAYLTHSKESSILVTTFIGLFFLLFSDLLLPQQMMTTLASHFVALNPLVLAESAIRKIVFFGLTGHVLTEMGLLIVYVVMLFSVLLVAIHRHRHVYQ